MKLIIFVADENTIVRVPVSLVNFKRSNVIVFAEVNVISAVSLIVEFGKASNVALSNSDSLLTSYTIPV